MVNFLSEMYTTQKEADGTPITTITPCFEKRGFMFDEIVKSSVPVNSVCPILKPFRFLKQHRDQHHGGDRNGNDGIDYGEYDQVDQDLRF